MMKVHLDIGIDGVACGAHTSWSRRMKPTPVLDLPRTKERRAVTCVNCMKTWQYQQL
jgi:hypothetical protein